MKLKQTIVVLAGLVAIASMTLAMMSQPANAAVVCDPGEVLINHGTACAPSACPNGFKHINGSANCLDSHKCTPAQNYNTATKQCEDKATPTSPQNAGKTGNCGKYSTSIIPCPSGSGETAITGLLLIGINILTVGIGIAAVGGVAYAGMLYATAEDRAAQVTKAKMTIFNVVLGIGAYFLMFAFLQFLIPGGAFN